MRSGSPNGNDFDALLAAIRANPREDAPRLMLFDWLQEHAPGLTTELERWDAGTLRPGEWNQRFLPHYFAHYAPADFHQVLDEDLHALHGRRGSKLNYIAPRGGAKSTWCTLAYPLRAALEGWEPYTLILSDSSDQANQLLGHIKKELEDNALIGAVYPNEAGVGPEWNQSRIKLKNGCVIEALGTGKKARGRRNRSSRPSLIIFDDIQSNDDITSPTLRQRAWEWATREVIPAGDERSNFIGVGSALHAEAVSVRLGALAGWRGRVFPAVHRMPDRMDLWDKYLQIVCDGAGHDRENRAAAFLEENRAAMHAGASVYWPERWSIADLLVKRSEVGANAFLGEYQGVPATLEGAEWPADYFDWDGFWFDDWPPLLCWKVIALDPSKGTDGKGGDYQAHVLIGVAVEDGRYVIYVDADLDRLGVVQMCERTALLTRDFNRAGGMRLVDSVYCEENGTMGLLAPALDAASVKLGVYLPYLLLDNTERKEYRIRSQVGPPLSRRQLRFRRSAGARILVGQLQTFPFAEHDDGPDALATGLKRLAELMLTGGK